MAVIVMFVAFFVAVAVALIAAAATCWWLSDVAGLGRRIFLRVGAVALVALGILTWSYALDRTRYDMGIRASCNPNVQRALCD